ncbi:MAG: YjzC family protein [Paenibacillus sp. RIFOXYA1_FULL_44_5]|nr:MAG: YjzC family protein [Paenibacillus sp. RIFOXYA1_FULL_44_5]
MGEQTQFEPGDRAPNNGIYIEIGEDDFHTGINNPQQIRLKKGERFPKMTNHNRKWTLKGRM